MIYRVLYTMLLWSLMFVYTSAIENFIVLAYGEKEIVENHQLTYELMNLKPSKESRIIKVDTNYMLEIGPYKRSEILALSYMQLKKVFSDAVIIEKKVAITKKESSVHRVKKEVSPSLSPKKVYVIKETSVEPIDTSLWTALFGLALVGILFMFLSSDQIKRLKSEHEKIKSKHKKLEERQHEVLSSMGENIHTIAKEAMNSTSIIADKIKNTRLHKEMKKVIHNENELLDITDDLIKFLRLKSKKVVIQNEVFNFNHVLNEVAGLLHYTYKQNDTELIFNIDKKVPKYMLADSLQLGQILTNILEYLIQNSQSKEIKLEVSVLSSFNESLQLQFNIFTDIVIENSDRLFDSYYDESARRYVGLGLFVAQELTHLMNGELVVMDAKEGKNSIMLSLPIEEKNKEKRKYHLPNKELVSKKILIVDTNKNAALASEKLFAYFKAKVTILSVQKFIAHPPNFAAYDIVALSNGLFTYKILSTLETLKVSQELKVISLDNLFTSDTIFLHDTIDIRLKKPLTQEYVFDTLIELYNHKKPNDEIQNKTDRLLVYRDKIKAIKNIDLESFKIFRGKHLLIVEDNIINQKVVLSVLAKSGMILHVATNGKEAVDFIRSSTMPISFIFMDINMPIMDGYRATELIRSDERFVNVPIVALTALVSDHEIEKMFDMGTNAYLPKPVRIDTLYSALKMFLIPENSVPLKKNLIEIKPMVLEGLNINSGLTYLKGNEMFYKEVLKEFMDAYSQSDEVFERLVKEQRFSQVQMLIFDLKGLTGSIGAKEMYVLINEIYQHLVYNKPELLHSYVSRYYTTFSTLRNSITKYLAS